MDEIKDYMMILRDDPAQSLLKHLNSRDKKIVQLCNVDLNDISHHLIKQPYPMLQILQFWVYETKSLQNAVYTILDKYLIETYDDEKQTTRFLNFLANFNLPAHYDMQIVEIILPKIHKRKHMQSECIPLGLLARSDNYFLKSYLEIKCCACPIYNKKSFLFVALYKSGHIVLNMIKEDCLLSISQLFFKNTICILKFVNSLITHTTTIDDFKRTKIINSLAMSNTNNIQRLLYADLFALYDVLDFVHSHSSAIMDINEILQQSSALRILYYNTSIVHITYDECKILLERNSKAYSNIVDSTQKTKELEILSHFYILVTFFEIIVCRNNIKEFINEKFLKVHIMFQQIKDINLTCCVIENIFRLLFLRWEYFTSLCRTQEYRPNSSGTENVDINISASAGISLERCGFICREQALKYVLLFLKNIIGKKYHREEYKTAPKSAQNRLAMILERVNNSIWKLNVIGKNSVNAYSFVLEREELVQVVQSHFEMAGNYSSEEKIRERRHSNASRRKNKIKKRSISANQKAMHFNKEDKNIMIKMLGSPKDLVALCLGAGNLTKAKQMIQIFNLESTEFQKDLNFLKNMQQTTKILQSIYDKYKEEEIQSFQYSSAIRRIRRAAVIGFEVSKIANVVEKFALTNAIQQDEETQMLMNKHNSNYLYLEEYCCDNLLINNVLDLVLNLPWDYDISCTILNLTEQLLRRDIFLEEIINGEEKKTGCYQFFKNIVECMHLWKNARQSDVDIQNFLTNSCYSFKANKLIPKLENEGLFWKVFTKNTFSIETFKELKHLSKPFENLNSKINYFSRILTYISNLIRLYQIKDLMLEIPINKILSYDPRILTDDIIFVGNQSLINVENAVSNLNLNLMHILSLNFCTKIATSQKGFILQNCKRSNENIFEHIIAENTLLGYLLQKICGVELIPKNESEYFKRVLELPEIQNIALMYNGNVAKAGLLQNYIDVKQLYLMENKFALTSVSKAVIENIGISDHIQAIRSKAISKDPLIRETIELVEYISDVKLRAQLFGQHYTKIHNVAVAEKLVNSILLHQCIGELGEKMEAKLGAILKEIKVYTQIASIYDFNSWTKAYDFSQISPILVMERLLIEEEYKLCYEWLQIINVQQCKPKTYFSMLLTKLINITGNVDKYLLLLVESFNIEEVITFYDNNLEKFRSLPLLKYVIGFLLKHKNEELKPVYENLNISLKIFEHLSENEREQNWILFSKPLILMEQLIMNSKFELLSEILSITKPMIAKLPCKYCSNWKGTIHNSLSSNSCVMGSENSSEFILLNYHLYQKDHIITTECLDLVLRIYASKALDYQISETYSSSEKVSQSTDLNSLDSLCGIFVMPKDIPMKGNWIKDEEAAHCMCCRRAVFTMLIRRHHCRRCGRVVCFNCSTNRMKIPEIYQDVRVRVCNDCYIQTQAMKTKADQKFATPEQNSEKKHKIYEKWQLSGNLTHDKLLREEFCFEHTPSVALCLSILSFHANDEEYIKFLLYHCRILEKLLMPNPEVDYVLVSKMLNCLAVAAKVRGGPPECDIIGDNAEIIMSVVQNECESLLPMEPLKNNSLRKLGDALVSMEKWSLALDVFLKCGCSKAGVKAAHGLSCLRAGCFDTAREQFSHCFLRLCNPDYISNITKVLMNECDTEASTIVSMSNIKRPYRSPALLEEIIKIIESTSNVPLPETIARASIIRNSNTSLASTRSKRKENIPMYEPAINILNTLSNVKEISQGNYREEVIECLDNNRFIKSHPRMFEECLYYIFSYGSHTDVINFLIRHQEVSQALRYFILQELNTEIFVQNIYLKHLKVGKVESLIAQMLEIDESLILWKDAIIHTCRYLETKSLLNCLYQLQVLVKDPVRASMTCVKFYSMNCLTFRDLQNNSYHLFTARKHLQAEVELSQWEDINIEKIPSKTTFLMQMDPKTLNAHINTIIRQMEITKFLSKCEEENANVPEILKQVCSDSSSVPTLFSSENAKIKICILLVLCGTNVEEGFGLCFRVMKDYRLSPFKIYGASAKYLAINGRLKDVDSLINCIKSSKGQNYKEIDEILSIAIHSTVNIHDQDTKAVLDSLIRRIVAIDLKISCHIYMGQLKSAYLFAVQYNRINDIKKILRCAETSNQIHIKRLCEKKLKMNK